MEPVTKAVNYRNVDRKAWQQITEKHSGTLVAAVVEAILY